MERQGNENPYSVVKLRRLGKIGNIACYNSDQKNYVKSSDYTGARPTA